jgi:hypothetical protein
MGKHTPILTDGKTLRQASEQLQDHLPLYANGYKCKTATLVDVLVAISSQQMTLEQACQALPDTPDPTTIRTYLNKQVTVAQLAELEEGVNAALQAQLPKRLWRKRLDVAIDVHEQPYYGHTAQEDGLWVRGQRKGGTSRLYRIASAYVVQRGLRVTLGVVFMPAGVAQFTALQTLLRRVQDLNLRIKCLWLDRGFASVDVMTYLDTHGWPAIIGCPIRGKPEGQGTRALCRGRGSYVTAHTFDNHQRDQTYTAQLAVCRVFRNTGRRSQQPRAADWEIYIMINITLTPQQVRARYRHRFGIETSYRCANQVRGWTTSPNPAFRFLLLGLALYMYNVWVALMWYYTQVPRKGGRYLDVALLRLSRLKRILLHALESRYGSVTSITAHAAPLL